MSQAPARTQQLREASANLGQGPGAVGVDKRLQEVPAQQNFLPPVPLATSSQLCPVVL